MRRLVLTNTSNEPYLANGWTHGASIPDRCGKRPTSLATVVVWPEYIRKPITSPSVSHQLLHTTGKGNRRTGTWVAGDNNRTSLDRRSYGSSLGRNGVVRVVEWKVGGRWCGKVVFRSGFGIQDMWAILSSGLRRRRTGELNWTKRLGEPNRGGDTHIKNHRGWAWMGLSRLNATGRRVDGCPDRIKLPSTNTKFGLSLLRVTQVSLVTFPHNRARNA